MSHGDFAWRTSRLWLSPITLFLTRARIYGRERWPMTGGCVLAINHLAWVDIPVVGSLSPRNINYVAKVELARVPLIGAFLGWHGIVSIRRGESDRDAVRLMKRYAAEGRAIGVFVEGTRQKSGRPGTVQPGGAMVAIQEDVPVVPIAVYGTQFWRVGNFAPCSIAVGEPFRFEHVAKGGKGYREASAEIERRLNVLFDWLAGVHARGRPRGETPPI
ncbi:MAG TPA: lysophospholipid acyltransferase family protein [Gaiellaceae bacterium]|jgi:1-acyl-sn-glycerol-3-phosphate acyltransferase|nr:lysophospholipid acyltransferase family protein [Gaiellaceae bacterium]